MRQPSAETQLGNLRRAYKRLEADCSEAQRLATEYRGRMTKAEQETAEWKRRFDLLLARTPEVERPR